MNLASVVKTLNLKVACGQEHLERPVRGGYAGDLLSDVLANSKEGDLWITRQSHQNIVAVSSLKDHAGILLVQGKEPEADTLEKAVKEGIPVLVTELATFEIAGQLHRLLYGRS